MDDVKMEKKKELPSRKEQISIHIHAVYFRYKTRRASGMCIFVCFNDPKDTPVWIIIKLFLIFCCWSCFGDKHWTMKKKNPSLYLSASFPKT